ncbi:deoxyribose-phosphate aldolase [Lewinella sp. LCG006]|uniref:deoxyribose-phosphate aldolase n=1 Tax=Lewinella sp. LCG006 TaxID=3231911 RepID=UPI00345F6F54
MKIASFIDHTVLKPDATLADIQQVCKEAVTHGFAAVCVPPFYVAQARQALDGTPVKLATVIGFPLGYSATVAKVEEIKRAIDEGADEFDIVINIAAVKNANWSFVRNDIDRMLTACHLRAKQIKVIIETALLTEAEILEICKICNDLEPDYVKTSTGFNGAGATVDIVRLLRAKLKKEIKIKASGGIRTQEDAKALVEAGADRLGTSRGVELAD